MRAGVLVAAFAGGALIAYAPAGCRQKADIRDEPDGSFVVDPGQLPDADLEVVDSGLGTDAYPPCEDRPEGDCVGQVDFPCAFNEFAIEVAKQCQLETDCQTNGTVEVTMGADGCVASLAMDEPNDAIVACMADAFGAVQCPCEGGVAKHFFGLGNSGGCQTCSLEFPCPDGQECIDGSCAP